MEEIILDDSQEKACAEAVGIFLDYLEKQGIRLTPEEWFDALEAMKIPEELTLKLSSPALERDLVIMDRSLPLREEFSIPAYVLLILQIKTLEIPLLPREWEVLCYRCGFTDGTIHTLDEAAEYFQVSRDRIRQVENKALRRIRSRLRRRSKPIRDFYS